MEIWKKIEKHLEYEVSNYGKVRSVINGRIKILKQNLHKTGYWQISIGSRKRTKYRKNYFVHRLVANAFCQNDLPKIRIQVDHINRNIKNNKSNNLRWVSGRENMENRKNPPISLKEALNKIYEIKNYRTIKFPTSMDGKRVKLILIE